MEVNDFYKQYLHRRQDLTNLLKETVNSLSFEEAELLYEEVLSLSTDDALIVGLEILDKKREGLWVTSFSDSFGCMLWADGNYSMLPYLIEKMDINPERRKTFYDYIKTLVLGCSQTRTPLKEGDELELETNELIERFRNANR